MANRERTTHWRRLTGGYFQGVVPQSITERWHTIHGGTLGLAADRLQVIEGCRRPGATP
jgi:hypothetical protein